MYLPMIHVPGAQLVVLAQLGSRDSGRILAHEFAHYWWSRALLKSQQVETEAFARAFEDDYLSKSLD